MVPGLPADRGREPAVRVRVGPASGEAAELVHVAGDVAPAARYGAGRVDTYAVCSAGGRVGPRCVVGVLPAWLFVPEGTPAGVLGADEPSDGTRRRAAALAAEAGLTFSEYVPEPGSDVEKVFPGVMPWARSARVGGVVTSVAFLLVGAALVVEMAVGSGPAVGRSVGAVVGAGVAGVGAMSLPPVLRWLRRRGARVRSA